MLPPVNSPSFRETLKAMREKAGLSYSELARLIGISPVMPSRYENAEHSNATLPNPETYAKLNEVLTKLVQGGGIDGRPQPMSVQNATEKDLVDELKRRGAKSVTITW